jgi:hypothetical protein
MLLKFLKEVLIVLGCSQHTVGHGHQGDMPFNRLNVPDLIVGQPVCFPFFVGDFNGPAVPPDPCGG